MSKPLATDLADILTPLRPGGDLAPGLTYLGPRFDEGITLDFESMAGPFQVRMEPKEREGQGYLETEALRLTYRGPTPLPGVAHKGLSALGVLIGRNERQFRRVEYAEMAAKLRQSETLNTHGRTAEIRLIIRCNESCPFCHTDERAENVVFSLPLFKKHVQELKNKGIQSVILTGGEPTLRPDLCSFVAAVREIGIDRVVLQTNATRLHLNGLAGALRDAGLTNLFVSLHSDVPEVLAEMTGFAKALETTLAGLKAAAEAGIPITINHVLTTKNLGGLKRFPAFVKSQLGEAVQEIVFSVASPNFHGSAKSDLHLDPGLLRAPLSRALRDASVHGYIPNVPSLCGVPSCVLEEDVRPFHRDLADDDPKFHGRADRGYVAACDTCSLRSRCTGIWKETIERFGEKWILPVM